MGSKVLMLKLEPAILNNQKLMLHRDHLLSGHNVQFFFGSCLTIDTREQTPTRTYQRCGETEIWKSQQKYGAQSESLPFSRAKSTDNNTD